jgi:hypothetical protein
MTTPRPLTIDTARNADELLTALALIAPEHRPTALAGRALSLLRETADLCGVDAVELTKRQAIAAIVANF